MEKASNLNLAANQAYVAPAKITPTDFTLEVLTSANLLQIKGGGSKDFTGDKRRRRTGG